MSNVFICEYIPSICKIGNYNVRLFATKILGSRYLQNSYKYIEDNIRKYADLHRLFCFEFMESTIPYFILLTQEIRNIR